MRDAFGVPCTCGDEPATALFDSRALYERREPGLFTNGRIEHPCGDLEPPLDLGAVERALEYRPVRLINGGVDEDFAPEPRMKRV